MKNKVKTSLFITFSLFFILMITFAFTFEWPQAVTSTKDFSLSFGQPRGSAFANSLIFENSTEIYPADEGVLLINLQSGIADMGWYENTLGNAVVISHENQLITVYGNLEEIALEKDTVEISQETKIGTSGASGWQKGKNSLEFQVIDTKLQKVINPFMLMPKLENENKLVIKNLIVENNSGKTYPLSNYTKINTGVYKLYIDRQQEEMTYKTTVYVNGATVENIVYDELTRENSRLTIAGKSSYTFEDVYPDSKRQLLAEIILPRGKTLITIQIEDFFGNIKNVNYTIEVI